MVKDVLTLSKMKEFFASKQGKKILIALGVIIGISLIGYACTPSPIWGPGILKDSPVDVSILEPLTDFPEYDLDEMRARARTIDGVTGGQWTLTSHRSGGFRNSLRMSIQFDPTLEDAKVEFEERETHWFSRRSFEGVKVSDSVEATLGPVFWYRSGYPPFWYTNPVSLRTQVRVGNTIFHFNETLNSDNIDVAGVLTNQALQEIVEALDPANAPHD
jgi:hypothetical protein